ncbi:mannose-1-phosphate guanylyltransferase [bacterium AH-315-M05]|nr:mannose-1-phosphate guanylyltransferase [bacterium AH-315-M05]
MILKEDAFAEIIHIALNKTKSDDCLVTLGIKPSRPDTGYGYIQFNDTDTEDLRIRKVKTFTEKPNLQLAKKFLESGDFYWNSGIFVWSVTSILNAFDKHLSKVSVLFKEGVGKYNTPKEAKFIKKIYQLCKNISIDYGVMEKADNVHVVLSDFGWSDLGTWSSLYENLGKNDLSAGNARVKEANAIIGKNVFMYDSKNCIVNMPNDKLVVLQGLDDYIVVESDDTLLVCKKEDEQKIKQIVNDIKTKKR